MSADGGGREVAHRLFAAEYDDATLSHTESDEERAPNYVVSPTGARINRLFAVGTLTEVTAVSEEMLRARVADPTGAFVVYAGQYQPDQLSRLEQLEPPAFVAVTGKARTFEPDDGDQVYSSVRPESIAVVDADTRDRWVVDAARTTIDRIETFAAAEGVAVDADEPTAALRAAGLDPAVASGIALARSHYGTTPAYLAALRQVAVEAVRVVAGDRDQVTPLETRPDEPGDGAVSFADLAGDSLTAPGDAEPSAEATGTDDPGGVAGQSAPPDDEGTDDGDPTPTTDDAPEGTDGGDPTPTTDDAPEGTDDGDPTPTTDDAPEGADRYEMDDDERASLEAEFDTEFTPGSEIDPEEEAVDPSTGAAGTDADGAEEAAGAEEPDPVDGATDLEDVVVETMSRLDEGDGASRAAVLEAVTSETGEPEAAVEDAIQDALMDGRCYEPSEDRFSAI